MGPTLLSISGVANDATCFGFKDGSVSTISTGGNSNHKYLWNTTNTNKDLTNVSKGMYTVTVTDSKTVQHLPVLILKNQHVWMSHQL